MSRMFYECLDPDDSDRWARANTPEEPDQEEDEEEDEEEEEGEEEGDVNDDPDGDDDENGEGYSVRVYRFSQD